MRLWAYTGPSVPFPQGICTAPDDLLPSAGNEEFMCRQKCASKLMCKQEDDNPTLHMVAAFLLYEGRNNENDVTFEMMQAEGAFPRLVELVRTPSVQEDTRLHQMLLELMYESSRIQRLSGEDLGASNATSASRAHVY